MNKESKRIKSALSNADVRRGGTTTSCAGLTSCTSPKVQCHMTENSNTGVSSSFTPKNKAQWFVLRATYGRTTKALEILRKANIKTYFPMHYVVKELNGKRKRIYKPLLPNIIFTYMTREESYMFVKSPAPCASWLKYYTDKTKNKEEDTGKNPPVIIPDNEMTNFINLTSIDNEHIMVLPPERCRLKSGDLVRIIDGPFTGIIGKIGRAAGQQRVIIELSGIGNIATAYIPNSFMIKIDALSLKET